jgi:hypothetical protein
MLHTGFIVYNDKSILRAEFVEELAEDIIYRTVAARPFRSAHSQQIETRCFGYCLLDFVLE